MKTSMSAFNPSGLTRDFKPGDQVVYVPNHAHGDIAHPDVERGVVTSINPYFVFVRYGNETGAKATSPNDLRIETPAQGRVPEEPTRG
jgi:hypothetical protein